ncbi:MAG: PilZ domain-containing protein [Nannocystaceae bacterium]
MVHDDDDERRRSERYDINHEFSILPSGMVIYVSNISETGVFIQSRQRLPVGSFIDLRFTVLLDDPVLISATGKVVYHKDEPRGLGVEFVDLSPEMALKVQDVVSQARARSADESFAALRIRELTGDELRELDEEDANSSQTRVYRATDAEIAEEEPEYEDF